MPDLMTKIAFKESDGSVTQFGNRAENFSQLLWLTTQTAQDFLSLVWVC